MKLIPVLNFAFTLFFLSITNYSINAQAVQYTTTANGTAYFKETGISLSKDLIVDDNAATITVNTSKRFQHMEGFGYALTGGSASLMNQLPENKKDAILQEIFGENEISLGVRYIRISIGASDLDAHVFSYNDLATGETDSLLTHFSLSEDTLHLIPILKKALAIQPKLKIMATPWSHPFG
jgi:glucosylceramidase